MANIAQILRPVLRICTSPKQPEIILRDPVELCCSKKAGNHLAVLIDEIRRVYDYSENGNTFLAVSTDNNKLRIQLPADTQAEWKEKIQSLR